MGGRDLVEKEKLKVKKSSGFFFPMNLPLILIELRIICMMWLRTCHSLFWSDRSAAESARTKNILKRFAEKEKKKKKKLKKEFEKS